MFPYDDVHDAHHDVHHDVVINFGMSMHICFVTHSSLILRRLAKTRLSKN